MPMATIHKVGSGELYHIHFLDARVDPGFGHGGGGVDPGYDRPIHHPGHPDHGLPSSPGHPANRPPGSFPGYPSHGLPGSPGTPGNELPTTPPPQVAPGQVIVMVRGADGKWKYAALAPGTAPPKPLPEPTPPVVDNTLPPGVDNTLPPATPQPTRR